MRMSENRTTSTEAKDPVYITLLRYFSVKPSGGKDLGKNLARLLGQID